MVQRGSVRLRGRGGSRTASVVIKKGNRGPRGVKQKPEGRRKITKLGGIRETFRGAGFAASRALNVGD